MTFAFKRDTIVMVLLSCRPLFVPLHLTTLLAWPVLSFVYLNINTMFLGPSKGSDVTIGTDVSGLASKSTVGRPERHLVHVAVEETTDSVKSGGRRQ